MVSCAARRLKPLIVAFEWPTTNSEMRLAPEAALVILVKASITNKNKRADKGDKGSPRRSLLEAEEKSVRNH